MAQEGAWAQEQERGWALAGGWGQAHLEGVCHLGEGCPLVAAVASGLLAGQVEQQHLAVSAGCQV